MSGWPGSDYALGVAAGRIAERLDGHDVHFADINGSIKDLTAETHGMRLDLQGLRDAADADRATVLVTAEALEKQERARRDQSESRWSPAARVIAVVGVIATLAAAAAVIYGLTGR